MKNHELLDMIGDVKEEYVQAADCNVVRPRFRWGTLAACAACAALVVAAYPAFRALQPQGADSYSELLDGSVGPDSDLDMAPEDAQDPGLHSYIVMEEGGGSVSTYGEYKAGAGGALAAPPAPGEGMMESGGSAPGGDAGLDNDGAHYGEGGQEVPVQEAALWYDALLHTYRLEEDPEWYGGAWIAGERLLAVAIVDGFRTPELEAELQEAAGAGAVLQFSTVKYSLEFLNGLMEPAVRALEGTELHASVGVNVMANCLGVDLYSDSDTIPDSVLAALAHLDPDGDAIQIRVYPGRTVNTDAVKEPALQSAEEPVPGGAQMEPPAGEGELPAGEESAAPAYTENAPSAQYDGLPICGLPRVDSGAICGTED